MKFKFLVAAFCLVLTSSSLLAVPYTFNLEWSGNTSFLTSISENNNAYATGTLTVDPSLLVPAAVLPNVPPVGEYVLAAQPLGAISFTMTIYNTTSGLGNGTFTLADFVAEGGSMIFNTENTPLSNFTTPGNPVGQLLNNGFIFGIPGQAGSGDLVFSAGTAPQDNPLIPTISPFSFVMITEGGSGDYLQLVPEPGTTLTGIMTLALSAGVFVRSARRRAASR